MKSASRIKLAATVASVVRASTRPGAPSLPERVHAVPRLVRATRDGSYAGTTLGRLGLVAGAVAYVASPVDLLPEAVLPVVGAADDAVVISWAVKAFFEETERFIAWEAGQGRQGPRSRRRSAPWTPTGGVPSDASNATVPGVPLGGASDAGPGRGSRTGTGTGSGTGSGPGSDGVGDGLRRDRDSTGAAAPGRSALRVPRVTGSRRRAGAGAGAGGGVPAGAGDRSGSDGVRWPEGTRQAATDYVLESVRKRLER